MQHARKIAAVETLPRFTVGLARHADDVIDAQRLRWNVFAIEQGAELKSPVAGLDIDRFDGACEHLIVRETATGSVVGTYRILTAAKARALGGFYSEQEFDCDPVLRDGRDSTVEVGRSCVHPCHRGGAVIALLWSGLAQVLGSSGATDLIGCASVTLADGGHRAARLFAGLGERHLASPDRRATPRIPFRMEGLHHDGDTVTPPLIKGYLRAGAVVCGPPALDDAFGTADFLMHLEIAKLTRRYAHHYDFAPRPVFVPSPAA